jgi:hypothetical protein
MEHLLGKHLFSRQKDNLKEIIFYRSMIFGKKTIFIIKCFLTCLIFQFVENHSDLQTFSSYQKMFF